MKPAQLYATVFITGACVLVIEVLATRLLAPYFGSTIYSVSSILSVVLAALSLGYYFGGKLSDSHPSSKIFYGLIGVSGLLTACINTLASLSLPAISNLGRIDIGPLIASFVLFFIPASILGTLSPFAVKLAQIASPKTGTGSAAGSVFFWSTLGSIVGSLGTGFFLIPHMGVHTILNLTSAVLLMISGIGIVSSKSSPKLILIFAVIAASNWFIPTQPLYRGVIYDTEGLYEHITVRRAILYNKEIILLNLNKANSAAVYPDSDDLPFEYAKYFHLADLADHPKSALVIGSGGFTISNGLIKKYPQITVDSVDIEPRLYDLSQKYLRLTPNDRLHNIIADGRIFLNQTDKKYDFIFVDVFGSLMSAPTHFATKEFFTLVKDHLNPQGVVALNVIGYFRPEPSSGTYSQYYTFTSIFPNTQVFALEKPSQPNTLQNFIFASSSNKTLNLDLTESTKYFKPALITVPQNPNPQIVYTDDYAPVDYLSAKLLSEH